MQSQSDVSGKNGWFHFQRFVSLKVSLLAFAMVLGNTGIISASERVSFETPPVQPSAFKLKRAKAQGKTLEPAPGITLSGVLSTPEGDGPHPAVVILPESVEARHSYEAWAKHLTENGFVTLLVESLVSRGETLLRDDLPMNLLVDAHGGLAFLSNLDTVDNTRISLMGIGMSGWFVQRSLDVTFTRGLDDVSFNAGVAIYPHCNPKMEFSAPILVLVGENDTRVSMAACQSLIELNKPDEKQTKLKIYPRATHYFDNVAYAKTSEPHGEDWVAPNWFAGNDYDPEAHADAEREILSFLRSVNGTD